MRIMAEIRNNSNIIRHNRQDFLWWMHTMKKIIFIILLATTNLLAQTPTPTPILYSEKVLSDAKKLQQASLASDYAYQQTAYLCNNIGARLTGDRKSVV